MPVLTKINTNVIADNAVTSAKIPADAIISSDLAPNIVLTGGSVSIPSVTTANLPGAVGGTNASITATNGMLVYNSTLGMLQQRSAGIWSGITTAPVITSFQYSDGASATAENPAGGGVITVTGTNFDSTAAGGSANVGLTFGGTTATSISVNAGKTVITATVPAKAAGTVVMQVINSSGLTAETNFIYDAEPAWSATGALGSFVDGAFTNSGTVIRVQATEASDTITYAQTDSAGTVITTGVQGLTLGTGLGSGANSAANAGYLTGTLSASEGTTYTFYARAYDAEQQYITTPTSFNIISSYAGTGGTATTYTYNSVNYRVHKFTATDSTGFTLLSIKSVDVLLIGGGGGGQVGSNTNGSGGGGSGELYWRSITNLPVNNYPIVIGAAGSGGIGGDSQFHWGGAYATAVNGGAVGGAYGNNANSGSGSGGGAGRDVGNTTAEAAVKINGGGLANAGGYNSAGSYGAGGGGGGTGGAGRNTTLGGGAGSPNNGDNTAYHSLAGGGIGSSTFINSSAAETTAFLLSAVAGTDSSNVATTSSSSGTLYLGAGGGGSVYSSSANTILVGAAGGGGGSHHGTGVIGGAGMTNTGSGGGGARYSSGALGGSGLVIIRYIA